MAESREARSLERVLGASPPPAVDALAGPDQARLVDVIRDARRRQAADLEASFHATLKHIPFPLRGIVKKALLG